MRTLPITSTHSDALTVKAYLREQLRFDTLAKTRTIRADETYRPYLWAARLREWDLMHADRTDILADFDGDLQKYVSASVWSWFNQLDDNAGLIWLDQATVHALDEMAATVPEPDDVRDLCLPANNGLIVFETPPREGNPSTLSAIAWTIGWDYHLDIPAMSAQTWIQPEAFVPNALDLDQYETVERERVRKNWDRFGPLVPTPAAWMSGYGNREGRVLEDGSVIDWQATEQHPLRVVAAVAGYCAGKVEVTDEPAADPVTRRALKRTSMRNAKVSVVKMRRAQTHDTGDRCSTPTGRTIDGKRWIVRGHWRNQPCGPGRTRRRQVWISPYVKGDPEAPMTQGVQKLWKVDR